MKLSNGIFYVTGKNQELVVLSAIAQMIDASSKLPAGIRHRFTRIRKAILAEHKGVEESRMAICQDCGTLNEETQVFDFDDEGREAFNEAFKSLANEEFDVDVDPIEINFEILDAKGSEIDVNAVEMLESLGIVKVV